MMELGEESVQEHQALIDLLQSLNLNQVILVGGDFGSIMQQYPYFSNTALASEWLTANKPEQALILIKGSRSTGMEKLLEVL
jgi:UDP-N-acetylmuramoyl-tripeptide--D-alanyl-D-alanine ligase